MKLWTDGRSNRRQTALSNHNSSPQAYGSSGLKKDLYRLLMSSFGLTW